MNIAFMVSLAGPDSANLLNKLAKITHDNNGKWISSKVCYLEGYIAANIKIVLPEENAQTVKESFIAQKGLAVKIDDISIEHKERSKPVKLYIKSNDRLGLVCEISHVIQENGYEIIHIESHRLQVPTVSSMVFTSEIDIEMSSDSDIELLISELKTIDESMIVSLD